MRAVAPAGHKPPEGRRDWPDRLDAPQVRDRLGLPPGEEVASEARPVDERFGRLADCLKRPKALGERVGKLGGVADSSCRRGREKQAGLQKGEPGGHHQIVGRQFEPQRPRRLDEPQVLLDQRQNGDARKVDLLPPGKLQQQVQRTLEAVEIDRERLFAGCQLGVEIDWNRFRLRHESPLSPC